MKRIVLAVIGILAPVFACASPETAVEAGIERGEKNVIELSRRYEAALRRSRELEARIREERQPVSDPRSLRLEEAYAAARKRRDEIDGLLRGEQPRARELSPPGPRTAPAVAAYSRETEGLLRRQRKLREQGLYLLAEMSSIREMIMSEKGLPGK